MKKTVYLLGLTLLCGFPAQAQETAEPSVLALPQENDAQGLAENTEISAAQALPTVNTPAEEEQTIFFSDDLLEEVDQELNAPLFASEKEAPKPAAANVPTVKMPEEIKVPEIKKAPAPQLQSTEADILPAENIAEPQTVSEKPLPSSDDISEPEAPSPAAVEEVPQIREESAPEVKKAPQEDNTPATEEVKADIKELPIEKEIPQDVQNSISSEPEPAPQEIKQEAPKEQESPEISSSNPEMPEIKAAASAPETPDIISEQPEPRPETPAAPKPSGKATPKKNAFSLDENALLQSQTQSNSYSLDSSALSGSFLKNDSLSPSVLNRSIVNISPEQRAKMMMKKKYDEMDANQDGMVSENEFVEYKTKEARKIAHQVFKQIDRNDDKMLSQYEYGLLMDKMIENYIKQPKKK